MQKVEEIMRRNFDSRVGMMPIAYIMDKGCDFTKHLTDEEIDSLEGNGLMTEKFVKDMVRTARKIATECTIDDIMDYIFDNKLYQKGTRFCLYNSDFSDQETFENVCDDIGVDTSDGAIDGIFVPVE